MPEMTPEKARKILAEAPDQTTSQVHRTLRADGFLQGFSAAEAKYKAVVEAVKALVDSSAYTNFLGSRVISDPDKMGKLMEALTALKTNGADGKGGS